MRNPAVFWTILAIAMVMLLFAGQGAQLYTDWLWFGEIGLATVFVKILSTKLSLAVLAGLFCFVVLVLNILLARKFSPARITILEGNVLEFPENRLKNMVFPALIGTAAFFALLLGLEATAHWNSYLLFKNGTPYGLADPVFGKDIGFYLFRLPFLKYLYGAGLAVIFFSFVVTLAGYAAYRSIRVSPQGLRISPTVHYHVGVLIALFLILRSAGYLLQKWTLLLSQNPLIFGAGYTDIHARLPLLTALCWASLAGGIVILATLPAKNWRPLIGAIVFLLVLSGIGAAYPYTVQQFQVTPNELAKETPYITSHIKMTLEAYNLNNIIEREFPANEDLTPERIAANRETIENIRLWEDQALLSTYSQLQEIRTYYKFTDMDVDRYDLGGRYRQVMVSPRELSYEHLPSRIWINEHLTYTHGYGLCVSPVDKVTSEGLPEFFVKNIPPASEEESLRVTRPEIYYGEIENQYVVTNTKSLEFDYPSGAQNQWSHYAGKGGIPLSSFARKLAFAVRFGHMNLLLNTDITPQSRLLFGRNILERLQRIAPFLTFDGDPYIVVGEGGRLFWICDAYTTSRHFPYSQPVGEARNNYVRNSVKAVVDAYHGSVTFYVTDPKDPILQSYKKTFPDIFRDLAMMPSDLRKHLRYPLDFFAKQIRIYSLFHMQDPMVFYNKEDVWQIPRRAHAGGEAMSPYYVILRLPDRKKEEFMLMLPFTPSKKDNMAAWMSALCDLPDYGKLVVYKFPKKKLVYGPTQIEARIDQDPAISQLFTLWGQRGSEIIRGTLLVIPLDESLLYVEPIYLKAERGQLPELKRVIVVYGNQIAMEENLHESMARIFGKEAAGPPEKQALKPSQLEKPPPSGKEQGGARIEEARKSLERAMRSLKQFEEELRQLEKALR